MKQQSFQRLVEAHNPDNSNLFKIERASDMNNFFSLFILFTQHNDQEEEVIFERLDDLLFKEINNIEEFSRVFNTFYWVRSNYFRMKPFDKWEELQGLLECRLLSILESHKEEGSILKNIDSLFNNIPFLKGKLRQRTSNILQRILEEV